MILKAFDENSKCWVFMDNIKTAKIAYAVNTTDIKEGVDWNYTLVDLDKTDKATYIYMAMNNGEDYICVVGDKAYLLNNEGKTIERI